MRTLFDDIQFSVRILSKRPGFSLTIVTILALGLGINTVISSMVHSVLWRSLAAPRAERLVGLWENHPEKGQRMGVSPPNFLDWRRQANAFQRIIAWTPSSLVCTGQGEPVRYDAQEVSTHFFELLGLKAVRGRTFTEADEDPTKERVVIVSSQLWHTRFGGDPDLVGKSLILDDESFTVVGIVKANPTFTHKTQLWIPLRLGSEVYRPSMRGARYLEVMGHLAPGVTMKQAQHQMEGLSRRIAEKDPVNRGWAVTMVRWQDHLVSAVRLSLWALFGATLLLLLTVIANVVNLFIVRANHRYKELALRKALGASNRRLFRLTVIESLLLSSLGGLAALFLAAGSLHLLKIVSPWDIPRLHEVTVNGWMIFTCIGLSIMTGCICGLIPIVLVGTGRFVQVLKVQGDRYSATCGRNRIPRLLVTFETALSVILLVGAGLLVRSFLTLRQVDPGFNPDNTFTLTISLPNTRYPQGHQQIALFQKLLTRIQSTPQVISSGLGTNLPFSGTRMTFGYQLFGPYYIPDGQNIAQYHAVSPDYLRTLGIPLLAGREFSIQDDNEAARVAIVNEALAERFGGPKQAVGQSIGIANDSMRRRTIVGVVGSIKHFGLDTKDAVEVYAPFTQDLWSFMSLVIRTSGDAPWLTATIHEYLHTLDPDLPMNALVSVESLISQSLAPMRCRTLLVGLFSMVALLLATIGLYGVVAYIVGQRIQEFGIRMALGAKAGDITRYILSQGIRLTLVGLCGGLVGAWVLTRVLESMLYNVSPKDPLVFIAVSIILTAVSLLASYIPARRAARINLVEALRYE